MEKISFSLLGSMRVDGRDGEIFINGVIRRRLLARLLIAAGRPVPVGRLRDDLWDGRLPDTAVSTLKSHVSLLRQSLGANRLTSRDGGYQLQVGPGELDIGLFESDIAVGRTLLHAGDPGAAAERLGRGLRRWRGPALADVADLQWGRPDAVRLEELRAAALDIWFEARLAIGETREVIAEAEAAVRQYPLRENLWAKLITALYHAGRQADALAAYQRLKELLAEELGISPSPDLIALERAILCQELQPPRAATRCRSATLGEPASLPHDPSSFIPRPRELADLARLLEKPGLITLTGPGGTGKTRLAIQAARDVAAQFGGVWLCELAAVGEPAHLVREVAVAVGCTGQRDSDAWESIAGCLEDGSQLLILDNCEHLLDAAAAFSRRLLDAFPQLHLLATSHSPLGVAGEVVYTVPPMSVPGDTGDPAEALTFESVRLFVDRARKQQSSFALDHENYKAVAAVCARLDGLPLAVELAAARTRSMSVLDIERRLDDRFGLLTTGPRAAPARHRTLRSLIDWSYGLLSDAERGALGQLALFADGFDLDAAKAVTGGDDGGMAVLDLVSSLADKSLVQVDATGATARYRLLQTVREYALAKLTGQEQRAARDAHAQHFLRLIESAAAHFWGAGQRAWRDRLELEEENLRSAFATLLADGASGEALRFGAAISTYWNSRGIYGDEISLLESALDRDDSTEPTAERGAALAAAGYLHFRRGDTGRAQARLDEAASIARALRPPALMADVLRTMAWVADRQGSHDRAAALAAQAVNEALASGTTHLIARSFDVRASTQHDKPQCARADYTLALRYCHAAGDAVGQVGVLNNLAVLELEQGDHLAARACFTEALLLAEEIRDAALIPFLRYGVGLAAVQDGDVAAAESAFIDVLGQARRTGQKSLLAYALLGVAITRDRTGRHHDAVTLLGASAALFEQAREQLEPLEAALRDRLMTSLSAALGDRLDAALAAGRRLAVPEAIRLAADRPYGRRDRDDQPGDPGYRR